MFSYEGKRVLVTGAGRGIGRSIALDMAGQGADICIASRSTDQLESVADEIRALGRQAWVVAADLSNATAARDLVVWAIEQMGGLDVVVNNAGGGGSVPGGLGPLEDATEEALRSIYGLNLEAPFFSCLQAIAHMKENGGGSILNIASIDGVITAPGEALYGSAKAALISLTESLGIEAGQYGIRVNAIAPSLIDTFLVEEALQTDEQRTDRSSFFPINRVGKPADVSGAAVYLCSDEAEWVSGVTILVAGGQQTTSDIFRWVRGHNPVPAGSRL
jgi:NAD(P)-dependent dehydrogenase (short-subunit alcohol dehydrogenase family)